jgi:hypothetical protein
MDDSEVVQERQRSKCLGNQGDEYGLPFPPCCCKQVVAVHVLEGEVRDSGRGIGLELVNLDQIWVPQRAKGRKLATQGLPFPRGQVSEFLEGNRDTATKGIRDKPYRAPAA